MTGLMTVAGRFGEPPAIVRRWLRRSDLRMRTRISAEVARGAPADRRLGALAELAPGVRLSALAGPGTGDEPGGPGP
jgi:hypothetical protein